MIALEEYREAIAFYHGAAVALYRMPKSDTARIDMDEGEHRLDAAVRALMRKAAARMAYSATSDSWGGVDFGDTPEEIAAELLPEER